MLLVTKGSFASLIIKLFLCSDHGRSCEGQILGVLNCTTGFSHKYLFLSHCYDIKIYFKETNTLTLSYVKCPQGSGGRLRRASCCGRSQRPVGGYVHGRLQLALCWKLCFAKATLLGSKTQLAPQGSPHHTAQPSHWPSWAQVLLPVKYKHVMFSWRELLEWADRHITVAHISTLDELSVPSMCSLHQLLNDFIF